MLMNNRDINRAVQVRGSGTLGDILKRYPQDKEAVRVLYYRALARRPSDRELSRAVAYVHKTGKRDEAFEDVLWALINSTEFQTKR